MAERDPAREDKTELMALADELLAQATEIRRQWSELAVALGDDEAAAALAAQPPVAAPAPAPTAASAPTEPEPEPEVDTEAGREPSEDLRRLVALDMLLYGSTREEVTEHLRQTFGDEGIDELVASVFQEYSEG
jgi:hypothetical protein